MPFAEAEALPGYPLAAEFFFDRLRRVADLFDGVPQFGGGDSELLGPVPDLIVLAEIFVCGPFRLSTSDHLPRRRYSSAFLSMLVPE
jgi:hypothetical protein